MGLLGDYLPDFLPDDPDQRAAVRMGLLNFGAAMLANANQGLGGALGNGLLAGAHGYDQGLKNRLELQQKQLQTNWMRQAAAEMTGGVPAASTNVSDVLKTGAAQGSVGPTAQNAVRLAQTPLAASNRSPGLSLQTLQTGALLGMRNIEPLFNIYKYQQDGIERKPGSYYQNPVTGEREYVSDPTKGFDYDPIKKTVTPIAGYNDTIAAQEAAKTAAQEREKAAYQLLPLGYTTRDGRPIGGTVGQYIGSLNTPAARPKPFSPTQPTTPANFPRITPGQQQEMDSERYRIVKAEYDAETDPANKAALRRELSRISGQAPGAPVLQSEAEREAQVGRAKAAVEREKDRPIALSSAQSSVSGLDRLETEARAIMNDPALWRITGATGKLPNMPGSAAANVAGRLETLKSQIGFGVLQAMRDASKTGGALGSVSNEEQKLLQNNLAALDTAQSPEAFQRSLQQIINYARATKGRLAAAYKNTYGVDFEPAPATPTAKTWQDYGYPDQRAAINDAQNAILKNPGAKAEIIRRLEESGITNHGIR